MSGILDLISGQLGGAAVSQLSQQIGADDSSTQKAVAASLPLLLGGLARNASSSPDGAAALAGALDRDHDGGILDNLSGLLGGSSGLGGMLGMAGGLLGGGAPQAQSRTTNGDGILGHVLGSQRNVVEQQISKSSGLDIQQIAKLLPVLAPIVMGALGKVKRSQNLDPAGLASMLTAERDDVERKTPGMKAGGLAALLDGDGDGDVMDDVAKIGSGLLSSFFKK